MGARSAQGLKAVQHDGWQTRRCRELSIARPWCLLWTVRAEAAGSEDMGWLGHGVDDLGVDGPEGVVAASGQLAGDGDRRDLAVVGVLDLGVVVVVGGDLV